MTEIRKTRSLRTVLLLQVALPVFILLAVLLTLALTVITEMVEGRLQRDLAQVARAVQLPVSQALERNDIEQLSSNLESIFEISEVYGAYVFDVNGDRLVSFGSVRPTRSQSYRAVELSMDVEVEFSQYERISGRDVYSFFLPLFDTTGRPNGLLQVTRRRSQIEQELRQVQWWSWFGFGVVCVLMLGSLMLTHHHAIGQPLGALLSSMQRVKAGERQHRAAQHGPEEVRELARGLNTMLDAIHRAEEQAAEEFHARESMAAKLRHAETMAMLGQLSAGVAHELGAPLSVVDGRAARLQRHCDNDKEARELDAIRQQVGRMSSLVEQLLSFGRNSRAPQVKVSITDLVDRMQAMVREEGWLSVRVEQADDVFVKGDMLSLEQALGNLLRNAVQACPQGPVVLGWTQDKEDVVCLYVEDAGPGIAEGIREQLFEPFVTTKLPGEGSGMGLAIVERVVREHQGTIDVKPSGLGGVRMEMRLQIWRERA